MATTAPAFSFYPKDWLAATMAWPLEARGAYITLLAYQWDAGGIPGDDLLALARVMGVTVAKTRSVWDIIMPKFTRGDDGLWRNARLERERQKQAARHLAQQVNGAKGGRPPRKPKPNPNESQDEPNDDPETVVSGKPKREPKPNPNKTLSSSSSFSSSSSSSELTASIPPTTPTQRGGGGLVINGAQYEKLQQTHAFVGAKLRVPKVLHAELVTKSGTDADRKLRQWYGELDADLEASGHGTGDIFVWLRPRHQAFAMQQGWIAAAPTPAQPKPRGVADILAEREAKRRPS